MKSIPINFPIILLWAFGYTFICLMGLLGIHTSAFALTKEEIRTEAREVMVRFEAGEISEASAISQLDVIEKKAQLLNAPTTITSTSTPKEIPKLETVIGTSLVRMAAFPELSPWGKFWGILRPILLGVLMIVIGLWFTLGIIGAQKLEIWSRKLSQIYRDKRGVLFPASRTPMPAHGVPPLPSGSHTIRSSQVLRHSGEVPDSLT